MVFIVVNRRILTIQKALMFIVVYPLNRRHYQATEDYILAHANILAKRNLHMCNRFYLVVIASKYQRLVKPGKRALFGLLRQA